MVVDAVLANDEWDLVLFRLDYLASVVDTFYIGESDKTFSGLDKELFFTHRLAELRAKGYDVHVIPLDIPAALLTSNDRWAVETHVRNSFLQAVCEKHPEDLVLFADVDEIPSRQQVTNLREEGEELRIKSIPTQVCLRKANWIEYQPHQWWGKWGNGLRGEYWIPRIRREKHPLVSGEPGAHLSYVGMGSADVRRKYQSFSHGELDRDDLSSSDFLAFADAFHISHLGRALEPGAGLLTVATKDDFTELQRVAYEWRPQWFSLEPVTMPRSRRLVASWVLFGSIRGSLRGELSDAYAPQYSWRWLRHALAYAMTWVAWKLASGSGLVALRKRTRREPS